MSQDPIIRSYLLADLHLTKGVFEKRMGFEEGKSPDPIPEIIEGILETAPAYCDIRAGYVMPEKFHISAKESMIADGIVFHTGKIITKSLLESEKIVFFLITAGKGIEQWSREKIRDGDPMTGYIIDMLGSGIVESAADFMQSELEKNMNDKGYSITNRYSPGYCGWLVDEQQKLFTFFPDNFCGITLSDSSLMVPIKSISGIIGVGKKVKKTAYGCQVCDMQNCIYRQRIKTK